MPLLEQSCMRHRFYALKDKLAIVNGQKSERAIATLENGERGIRTLVTLTSKQHFQCCAFNRSAISPGAKFCG
jgi:hypothetical protein